MRIGIFGGTFNPIHHGHLIAAEEIRESFCLDRIIFVPSARPPHKPNPELIDIHHRLEMTRLAIKGNPFFKTSSIEEKRRGLSYSVKTVEDFKNEFGKDASLFFLLGIDAFTEMDTWYEPQRLLGLCHFIVISRPGFSLQQAHQLLSSTFGIQTAEGNRKIPISNGHFLYLTEVTPVGISSTQIRSNVSQELSVKYLLPEKVESYIISHDLYKNSFQ